MSSEALKSGAFILGSASTVLEIQKLSGGYGTTPVLHDVNVRADEVELLAVLGRNGMGKTALMRAIVGLLPISEGRITLGGQDISGLPTHKRARAGIAYVPQGRGIFPRVTLEENLRFGLLLGGRRMGEEIPPHIFEVFPWMRQRLGQTAETLSGGEQQMLAIARAMVADPKVLLLDEPTEGLAPAVIEHLMDVLTQIRDRGRHAILLVEQNLRFALSLATRGYVLEKGRIVAEGDPAHLQREEIVVRHLSF
jgi:urea transport system ATP-binding protein